MPPAPSGATRTWMSTGAADWAIPSTTAALLVALVVDLVERVARTVGTVANMVERVESAAADRCGVLPLAPRVIVTPPGGAR